MELELGGKTALVTGSSRGIGAAIATALHAEGCRVALNARTADSLRDAPARLAAFVTTVGDMSRPDDATRVVREAVAALGRLDILICNVGSGKSVPPGHETADEWQRVFAQNLWATTNAVEAARAALADARGSIVCISSICGMEVVPGAPVTYSVAKAALHAYVRGIARPLGKLGVRINAVAPGNILFNGSVWDARMSQNPSAVTDMLQRDVSLARLGTPEEIAGVVAYLASPRSAFATGAVWTIDGGQVHA